MTYERTINVGVKWVGRERFKGKLFGLFCFNKLHRCSAAFLYFFLSMLMLTLTGQGQIYSYKSQFTCVMMALAIWKPHLVWSRQHLGYSDNSICRITLHV